MITKNKTLIIDFCKIKGKFYFPHATPIKKMQSSLKWVKIPLNFGNSPHIDNPAWWVTESGQGRRGRSRKSWWDNLNAFTRDWPNI